jgi:hypothetical protein
MRIISSGSSGEMCAPGLLGSRTDLKSPAVQPVSGDRNPPKSRIRISDRMVRNPPKNRIRISDRMAYSSTGRDDTHLDKGIKANSLKGPRHLSGGVPAAVEGPPGRGFGG